MKKFLMIVRNIVIITIAMTILIASIRKINDIRYRPKGYDPSKAYNAKDLSRYETDIDGVQVSRIIGDYMNGFRLLPEHKTHKGVLVTFGGSEGSPSYEFAELFAKEGYEVLALFFFGMDNQQPELVNVPLDFFKEVLAYIDENVDSDSDEKTPVTVYGASKGAELALNLAVIYPEIDNIVVMAPGAWSFMGLPKQYSQKMYASWTLGGKEVPYIDMSKGDLKIVASLFLDFLLNRPIDYRPGYESASMKDPNSELARIKVENTKANILIFAGDDDKMWHSEVSAKIIQEHRPKHTEVHIFEGAGHVFSLGEYIYSPGMILEMGGSAEANKKAAEASYKIFMENMAEWHGKQAGDGMD